MYKRYLEPDNNSPLTTYMTKKIKKEKKNLRAATHKIAPSNDSNSDTDLIQDNNKVETETVVERIAYITDQTINEQEELHNIHHEKGNVQSHTNDYDYFHLISEELIHPNLQCKNADAITMILAFFLQHHLTYVALKDLLDLFHEILGEDSNLPKTNYFFKKCFGSKQRSVFHFYCKKCTIYIDTYESLKSLQDGKDDKSCDKCSLCGTEYSLNKMNDGHFFVELPLREQIERKISDNVHMLDFDTNSNSTDITDIFDGELYKSLRAKVGNVPLLTLTLNTDGVRVFKSKRKASMWPIQMFINEVPPQIRLKQYNIILTGIWFGKDPNFEIYFKPLNKELKDLDEKKINVEINNIHKDVTVRVLLTTLDSPAKCKCLKLKQYNGKYGCVYCLHPGCMVGDSTTSKYIISSVNYSLRTHSSTVALKRLFLLTGKESFGVMGVSPFIGFRDYDLIRGTVIDYMHAILEGVSKLKLDLWFDSKHHREKYYITPRGTEVVNKNIKSITPLKTFSIKPRPIEDKEFWKAHELKYWLLFYGVPCLTGTLNSVYLSHFALLSEAIYIFLKSKITAADFLKASNNLNKYHKDFQNLYGEENMMHCVHLVHHLPKCVRDCGPLWAYSNFNFESNNGSLVKHVNGTTDVEHQIASKYYFNNVLADLRKKGESTFNYIERMKSMRVKKSERVGQITLFGSSHKHKLSIEEKKILLRDSDYIMAYYKFFYGNDVYFSTTYKRAVQTDDTVVLLKDDRIGQITLIFKDEETVYVLLKILQAESVDQFPKHIKQLSKDIVDEYVKVPAEEVAQKLLLISTVKEIYLSELPNHFESD